VVSSFIDWSNCGLKISVSSNFSLKPLSAIDYNLKQFIHLESLYSRPEVKIPGIKSTELKLTSSSTRVVIGLTLFT